MSYNCFQVLLHLTQKIVTL